MPPATRKKTRRLTDAQLQEMLALTSHADSVEFFDTPDLRLNKQGSGRAGRPGPWPR